MYYKTGIAKPYINFHPAPSTSTRLHSHIHPPPPRDSEN